MLRRRCPVSIVQAGLFLGPLVLVPLVSACARGSSSLREATEAAAPEPPHATDAELSAEPSSEPEESSSEEAPSVVEASSKEASVEPAPPRHYRRVVQTGDSMVGGGLCKALAPKFKAEGTEFVRDVWESASIVAFAESDRLPKLLRKYDPDLVLLTLGANDVFNKHPEYMIRFIERIVRKVGSRDCYWIGPPLWNGDFGLSDVIRDHVSPCAYFDSRGLSIPRAGDGIHPTDKGGDVWADAFWGTFRPVFRPVR